MLDLFPNEPTLNYLPEIPDDVLSDEEVIREIGEIKKRLQDEVVILGHHYQQDDVIEFADFSGDSLLLAKKASALKKPYIIFCGVHFMAETADMLIAENQKVILPDLDAGCSMADMANSEQIEKAWQFLGKSTKEKIIPVTYINCSAELKSFVGKNGGSICTSSNAKKIVSWALDQGEKLLFFPDQHLGRNTCFELGIPLDKMVVYNPNMKNGGLTETQVREAKVILWYGFCSVHQGFTKTQIDNIRSTSPETTVLVHPECNFEVVQNSDLAGSTSFIIDTIKESKPGSKFAVGTEINLVNRLASKYTDKEIKSLSPYQCLCTTMYRVRPRWLLASLRGIENKKPSNIISVSKEIKENSLKALSKMLEIS